MKGIEKISLIFSMVKGDLIDLQQASTNEGFKKNAIILTSIFNGYPDLTSLMPFELKTLCVINFILRILVKRILKFYQKTLQKTYTRFCLFVFLLILFFKAIEAVCTSRGPQLPFKRLTINSK